ncbi:NEL-type E3 ubiquitin ligase domain-containing protein [Pseudomonas soli]|uniref:RING-type E3 ubiquitin transferase n=1 Tax=Pseudomonas soli TaxID=1306993 RepID=A0ABU7GT45_9PSED|nr:NEL-type E3 ubiquitin ligase domain-containing protein [Pseudomonas soli]MEE1882047.1 NEL-type E3 ubiquitin ligase domain-containing protein [Pseudomonas soli]
MTVAPFFPHSIDGLIARQLPVWMTRHGVDHLLSLRLALRRQEAASSALKQVLDGIPSLEKFAEQLLEPALRARGVASPDVRRSTVRIVEQFSLPTVAPSLYRPSYERSSIRTLLVAALHNFHVTETRPGLRRKGQLHAKSGRVLPLGFEAFAGLCRQVDIGGRYQALLNQHLVPSDQPGDLPGEAAQRLHRRFEESLRSHFEVAVRIATLKGNLDEQSYLHLLPVTAPKPIVPTLPGVIMPRQLYLLGKCVRGVVTLEVRQELDAPLLGVIAWIPGDPLSPVARHDSWQALYDALAERLRDKTFRGFFSRFISERDRGAFFTVLEERLQATAAHGVSLDGRCLVIDAPLFEHLRALWISKMLDDARVLAVPTGDEDQEERDRRLAAYASFGLDLMNLAGLFIPLVGEVMLGVAAVQIASEVYEGYQDWRIGDRQGALDHLFGVAENVILGAVMAKGAAGAVKVLDRSMFVDGLAPVCTSTGDLKLMADDLAAYHDPRNVAAGDQERVWQHDGFSLRIVDDPLTGTWRVRHPRDAEAYRPLIESNEDGGWVHELEQPHYWQGAGNLVRRFNERWRELPDTTADYLLQVTGIDEASIRLLHLRGAPAPARLVDALELHQVHEQFSTLSGPALAQRLSERQMSPSPEESVLLRQFPTLTARTARELFKAATGAEIEHLATGRVPLALAERARWLARQHRIDRSCAGLRLPRLANADTERLALGLLDGLAPWGSGVRIELRQGSVSGPLLAAHGALDSDAIRVITRHGDGYRWSSGPVESADLMQALLGSLEQEQAVLPDGSRISATALGERLAANAAADREQAALLMGLVSQDAFRPPVGFADGRVGYALSGRAGGSRQAIRRGIHQIFPTLSDDEMHAYLMNLMNQRIGFWEHYAQLQEQLAGLKSHLQSWRREAVNALDARRRRNVANALRRSWRRKLTNLADEYVLEIEGERVGSLPALPDGVDYHHVRRLTLRDMALAELDEGFLRRFPNLVELNLSGNHLTEIPAGIETLEHLRHLHLQGNRIELDHVGQRRLAALNSLQVLDLSHNPLRRAPVLTHLRSLRTVILRAVGLEALPDRVSWRATVDLRDNRIRQLRQDLLELRQQVERLALHDNPLDERSEGLLDEASGGAVGAARGAAGYRHQPVDEQLCETWLGSASGRERERWRAVWQALSEEPGSAGLFQFLADFSDSVDFGEHAGHYRTRVWRILDYCEQHEAVRQRLFLEASGQRTCEDGLLLILSQLELGVLVERAVSGVPAVDVEDRLMRLGRSLFRLDEVDRIAARHVERMREASLSVDEIEVRFFYRYKLLHPLGLPLESDSMHYQGHARVTTSDVLRAQDQVLGAETADALIESTAQRPFWAAHVRERYASRFAALAEPLRLRMEALEADVEQSRIDDWTFTLRSNALMYEFELAERRLLRTLAREVYQRLYS